MLKWRSGCVLCGIKQNQQLDHKLPVNCLVPLNSYAPHMENILKAKKVLQVLQKEQVRIRQEVVQIFKYMKPIQMYHNLNIHYINVDHI